MSLEIIQKEIVRVEADAVVIAAPAGEETRLCRMSRKQGSRVKYIYMLHMPEEKDLSNGEKRFRESIEQALRVLWRRGCRAIAFSWPLGEEETDIDLAEEKLSTFIEVAQDFRKKNKARLILAVQERCHSRLLGKLHREVDFYLEDRGIKSKLSQGAQTTGKNFIRMRRSAGAESGTEPRQQRPQPACPPVMGEGAFSQPQSVPPPPSNSANFSGRRAAAAADSLASLERQLKGMQKDSFERHLQQLINKKGMKNSEVYAAANISKQYFSKLMKGRVKPSKEKVLALAVGLQLNLDETIDFLRIAGYALSPVSQTDVVVEYFIRKKDYSVVRIDIVLFDYGLPTLSESVTPL